MEWGGECNHTKCNLNNIFHEGKGHFATGEWAFFVFSEGKIIATIKKCNLNNIFHEGIGYFAAGENALFVFSENLGGLDPFGPSVRNLPPPPVLTPLSVIDLRSQRSGKTHVLSTATNKWDVKRIAITLFTSSFSDVTRLATVPAAHRLTPERMGCS